MRSPDDQTYGQFHYNRNKPWVPFASFWLEFSSEVIEISVSLILFHMPRRNSVPLLKRICQYQVFHRRGDASCKLYSLIKNSIQNFLSLNRHNPPNVSPLQTHKIIVYRHLKNSSIPPLHEFSVASVPQHLAHQNFPTSQESLQTAYNALCADKRTRTWRPPSPTAIL
jgi:hypothetical protein